MEILKPFGDIIPGITSDQVDAIVYQAQAYIKHVTTKEESVNPWKEGQPLAEATTYLKEQFTDYRKLCTAELIAREIVGEHLKYELGKNNPEVADKMIALRNEVRAEDKGGLVYPSARVGVI